MTTYTFDQITQAALRAGFTTSELPIAYGIAMAESGGTNQTSKPNADGTIDRGCWQINSIHTQYNHDSLVNDLQYNANAAYDIYKSSGWNAWTTYRNGAYKRFGFIKPLGEVTTELNTAKQSDSIAPSIKVPGLNNIAGLVSQASKLLSGLTTAAFWKSAGIAFVGMFVLVIGIILVVDSTDTGSAALKTAGEAALT